MCTVSVVKLPHLLRLVANRDELRARPPALPPSVSNSGPLRVLAPTDPASGGTWIAVNDAGLSIALLNVNRDGDTAPEFPRSRGGIVPALMQCRTLAEVEALASAIDSSMYSPFRLVVVHAGDGHLLEMSPATHGARRYELSRPHMFTSSGLGDHHVEPPRRELFEATVLNGNSDDVLERQEGFHAHRWADRPAVSVHMSRADAWTVSRTVVDIEAASVTMTYCGEPGWAVRSNTLPRVA